MIFMIDISMTMMTMMTIIIDTIKILLYDHIITLITRYLVANSHYGSIMVSQAFCGKYYRFLPFFKQRSMINFLFLS